MNHAELRARVTDYFRTELAKGKERRAEIGPFSEVEREDLLNQIRWYEEPDRDFWRTKGRDQIEEEVNKFFDATGLSREVYWPYALRVLDEMTKARVAAYRELLAFSETLEGYDFSDHAKQSAAMPDPAQVARAREEKRGGIGSVTSQPQSPLLSELEAERREEAIQSGGWSTKASDDYRVWIDLFLEVAGDRPVLDYSKVDARRFRSILQGLPKNRQKYPETQGLAPQEAVAAAEAHGLDTLSTATVNKALGRLQALWKWADRQLDEDVPDIFGPIKIKANGNARADHDPFTTEQLQTIFASPLYTGCHSERFRAKPGAINMSGTSWYWLPLLGLYTGARLNELCQLRLEDIGERDDIPFLRIHAMDDTQRVKGGKKRVVPLHPQLVELGFLRFVTAQRGEGQDRLFPGLVLDKSGYYSDRSSKDFSNYLRSIGAKTPKTSFHSFRHNFKDILRYSGVQHDINDILLGHSLGGMAARYGNGDAPIPMLYEAVAKVRYPGISLEHIRRYE